MIIRVGLGVEMNGTLASQHPIFLIIVNGCYLRLNIRIFLLVNGCSPSSVSTSRDQKQGKYTFHLLFILKMEAFNLKLQIVNGGIIVGFDTRKVKTHPRFSLVF